MDSWRCLVATLGQLLTFIQEHSGRAHSGGRSPTTCSLAGGVPLQWIGPLAGASRAAAGVTATEVVTVTQDVAIGIRGQPADGVQVGIVQHKRLIQSCQPPPALGCIAPLLAWADLAGPITII